MEINKERDTIQKIFTAAIEEKGLRKTPERFAILDEIDKINGHFSIDSLHQRFQEKKFHISRATLYNTVELLFQCNLITKHYLGKDKAEYEKSYNSIVHNHIVCTRCGKTKEFTDVLIKRNIQNKHYKNFELRSYSLVVYGVCKDCQGKH